MKPCNEKNGAVIYVGRAATVHNPLFQRPLQRLPITRDVRHSKASDNVAF